MAEQHDFKLEHYKYILRQIQFLNESAHQYLTFFQGLATLILGGVVALFINWKKLGIPAETAQTGVYLLLGLLFLLALFVIAYLVAGIFSWLDYRKEEATLLDEVIAPNYRSRPQLKNAFRWHETWIILSIITFVLVTIIATHLMVIPLIR